MPNLKILDKLCYIIESRTLTDYYTRFTENLKNRTSIVYKMIVKNRGNSGFLLAKKQEVDSIEDFVESQFRKVVDNNKSNNNLLTKDYLKLVKMNIDLILYKLQYIRNIYSKIAPK